VRIHHEGRVRGHQQGVAVGRGFCNVFGADLAVGAGLVLDHRLLSEGFGQTLPKRAGEHIGDAAGRERNHDVDGLLRIGLRCRAFGKSQAEAERQAGGETKASHRSSS
jgi:hypothetical protein